MPRGLRTSIGLALGLGLLLSRPAQAQFLSPGELSQAHKSLDGDDHCTDCHASGRRVDNPLCTKCHDEIGASLRAGTGLHGKKYQGKPCGECHVEHRGRAYDLVRWPGGAQKAFDHAQSGWPLQGAHAAQTCKKCHARKNEHGAETFLGLSTTCASCHEDPHKKRFGNDCLKCHDQRAWKNVAMSTFDHALARFDLLGKHKQVQCAKCHGEPAQYKGIEFSSCTSCHKDPHTGRFGDKCSSCHNETGWDKTAMKRGSHPGLSILGGHADVRCGACHDRGDSQAPSRGSRCVACHAPIHEAKFGKDCAACHQRIRWLGLPDAIGRDAHSKTVFPLVGEHRKTACDDCHVPKLPAQQRFRELKFGRCIDCHRDVHNGEFAARDGGECKKCHDEHGFSPTQFSVEAHVETAFPLVGRHVAVACSGCHKSEPPRLNWHESKQQCADCHQNPHGEQFASEMQQSGCAHCHNPMAWNVPNIDHGTWPLTGAHALAQCGSCHNPTPQDRRSGQGASYRGVPRDCEGCHDDAHKGQFRLSDPVRECKDCHSTTQFTIASFDHAHLANYPLTDKHAQVACADCHATATLRNGEQSVRFRLGFQKCSDCHKNPHAEQAP